MNTPATNILTPRPTRRATPHNSPSTPGSSTSKLVGGPQVSWGAACFLAVAFLASGPATGLGGEPRATPGQLQARAKAGDPQAQYQLGRCYELGQHVTPSLRTARRWFTKAAEQKHPDAQYRLGKMYAEGRGVRHDWARARDLWRDAALHGSSLAQNAMGRLCETGTAMRQDLIQACFWYSMAASDPQAVYARANLQMLTQRLTPEEISDAMLAAGQVTAPE